MRQNASKVIEAFKVGQAAAGDSKRTISTDGTTILSYAMPIARRVDGVVQVIDAKKAPSNTTRAQIRACMVAFPEAQVVQTLAVQTTFPAVTVILP